MDSLDERLLAEQEKKTEEEQSQQREEADQAQAQEEYRRELEYRKQVQEEERRKQAANPVNQAQQGQKWYKRYRKTVVVLELLGATAPIWGTVLMVLFVVGAFMVGCNQSTFIRLFNAALCKPFMIDATTTPTYSSGGAGAGTGFEPLTDAAARKLLSDSGIAVNKVCIDQTRLVGDPPGQTCLGGIQGATIMEVINFSNACKAAGPCVVVFTGGTENGHSDLGNCSHGNGYKADIRADANVDAYIQNPANFTKIANRGSDNAAQYKNNTTGVIYARESNHWDIGGVNCA